MSVGVYICLRISEYVWGSLRVTFFIWECLRISNLYPKLYDRNLRASAVSCLFIVFSWFRGCISIKIEIFDCKQIQISILSDYNQRHQTYFWLMICFLLCIVANSVYKYKNFSIVNQSCFKGQNTMIIYMHNLPCDGFVHFSCQFQETWLEGSWNNWL